MTVTVRLSDNIVHEVSIYSGPAWREIRIICSSRMYVLIVLLVHASMDVYFCDIMASLAINYCLMYACI